MGYNPAIPTDHAEQPLTGALRYLADRKPERFAALGDVPQNVISHCASGSRTRAATTRRSSSATTSSGGARSRPSTPT